MKNLFTKIVKKILSFLPKNFVVNVYNFLNKISIFESLTNNIIKKLIPESINIPEGRIFLNQSDVGVSGHLALGTYEKKEVDLFRDSIKSDSCVVDIGGNIGYYSVVAGKKIGEMGKLFVYEPEEVNLSFLRKNLRENNISAVVENIALSDRSGTQTFFLTKHNKGTHSLVNNRGVKESVVVKTDTLDSSLAKHGSPKVNIIKMDIEGAEVLALDGMKETINRSDDLIIFTEFYPKAIKRLGHAPVVFLNKLKDLGFSIFVIYEEGGDLSSVGDFNAFVDSFPDTEFVRNLYAVKS